MLNKLVLGTVQFGLDYGVANDRGRIPRNEVKRIVFGVDSFHQFEQIINSFNLKFPSKFPKWQYPIDDYLINLNKW